MTTEMTTLIAETVGSEILGFWFASGRRCTGRIYWHSNIRIFCRLCKIRLVKFVFNLVFCATTATIVSGAMAERTKCLSYCIYSAIISAVVYPIEAHWLWHLLMLDVVLWILPVV